MIKAGDGDTLMLDGITTSAQLQGLSGDFTFHCMRPTQRGAGRTRRVEHRLDVISDELGDEGAQPLLDRPVAKARLKDGVSDAPWRLAMTIALERDML